MSLIFYFSKFIELCIFFSEEVSALPTQSEDLVAKPSSLPDLQNEQQKDNEENSKINSDLISKVSQIEKSTDKAVEKVEQVTDTIIGNNDDSKDKQAASTEKTSEAEKCKQSSKSSGKTLSMETRSASMASDTSEREIPSLTPRSDPGSPIQDSCLVAEQASQLTQNVVDIMTQSIYLPSDESNFDSIEETTQLLTDRSTFSVVGDKELTVVESTEQESKSVSVTSESLNSEMAELKNEVSIQNIVKTEAKTISEKSSDLTSSSATIEVSTSSESKVHTNITVSDTVSEHKLFSSESVSTISTTSIHSVESKSEILKTSSIETKISTSLQCGEVNTLNDIQKSIEGSKTQKQEDEKRENNKSAFKNGEKSPIESEDKTLSDKEKAQDNMDISSEQKESTLFKEELDDEIINSKEDLDNNEFEDGDQIESFSCDTKVEKDSENLPGNESDVNSSKSQIKIETEKQEQDSKDPLQTNEDNDSSEVQEEIEIHNNKSENEVNEKMSEETAEVHIETENNESQVDQKRDSICSQKSSSESVEVEFKDSKLLSKHVNDCDSQVAKKRDSVCSQKLSMEPAEQDSEADQLLTVQPDEKTVISCIKSSIEATETMQQSEVKRNSIVDTKRSSIISTKSADEADSAKKIDSTIITSGSDIADQKVKEVNVSGPDVKDQKGESISSVTLTGEEQQTNVPEIESLALEENGEELSKDLKRASISSIKSVTDSSETSTCLEQKRASVASIRSVTEASETLHVSEQKRASIASIRSMSETSEQITVEQKRLSISSIKSSSEIAENSTSLKRDSTSSVNSAIETCEVDSPSKAKTASITSIKPVHEIPEVTEEKSKQSTEDGKDSDSVKQEVDIKSEHEKKDIEKEKNGNKSKDEKVTKAAADGSSEISEGKESEEDPIAGWGKPLGLPSPIRPGTPSKHSRKAEEDSTETKVI